MDIGEHHSQPFVLLRHTRRPQRRPYTPFAQAGAVTSDTGAEAVKPDLRCSWRGHTQARNQLGTPGGAKSFLRGAQIF